MAEKTGISWTDYTFNPWMGCEKVSPGCSHCYAETLTKNRMGLSVWGKNPRRKTSAANWRKPLQWNKKTPGAKVFCASLADVFEDKMELREWRVDFFSLVLATPRLTWQILTKRPEEVLRYQHLPQNIWLGVSVENEDYLHRVDTLRQIPAKVRFISYEPALGPIAHKIDLTGIHWVIVGGESGPGYRPMDLQWARDMRDKCRREGVAFFFKQSAAPRNETGIELDGEVIHEFPHIGGWRDGSSEVC